DARARRADLLMFSGLKGQERDPQPFLDGALATDGRSGSALGSGLWTNRAFRSRLARARLVGGGARRRAHTALGRGPPPGGALPRVGQLRLRAVLFATRRLQGLPGRVRVRRPRCALQGLVSLRSST